MTPVVHGGMLIVQVLVTFRIVLSVESVNELTLE